jgi:hypothetical protein
LVELRITVANDTKAEVPKEYGDGGSDVGAAEPAVSHRAGFAFANSP